LRLADMIVAWAHKKGVGHFHAPFAEAVKQAQRFELDAASCAAIGTISNAPVAKLIEARDLIRPPFESTWFEWAGSTAAHRNDLSNPVAEGETAPLRTGILIESKDCGLVGAASLAWSARAPNGVEQLAINPLSLIYNLGDEEIALPGLKSQMSLSDYRAELGKRSQGLSEHLHSKLLANVSVTLNPRAEGIAHRLEQIHGKDASRIIQTQLKDWSGELDFIHAAMICLNSRNLMKREPEEDLSRLNKARRRLGRTPLLSFSTVKVSLSASATRRVGAQHNSTCLRAHLVRGHFKMRKSGVFWWSPFLRGDADAGFVVRSGYEVQG
jgi:hypothetical protein